MPRRKNTLNKNSEPRTISEAWGLLAVAVLVQAIDDVRQTKDSEKRERAKRWFFSEAGRFLFFSVMSPTLDFDLSRWVLDDCPTMGKTGYTKQ